MRIKGGGRVTVEVPRKKSAKKPPARSSWHQDSFETAPVRAVTPKGKGISAAAVAKDFTEQGKARVEQDQRRDRSQLMELGQLMGGLTAEIVVELINHFVQRAPPLRSAPMVVLGALTGALFVEFWSVIAGPDALDRAFSAADDVEASLQRELGVTASQALERFVSFIEDTEGQPTRRLMGTLYSLA